MSEITYFDACCQLGRTRTMGEGQPENPEQLLAAMDHFGIHEALVMDTVSADADPAGGNLRIVERTRHHPRLHPAWLALPTHSRETPPPQELVAQMREMGVGALHVFPNQFEMSLDSWAMDDLAEALQQHRVPLFICPADMRHRGATDATDWTNVVRICRSFPDLPVVVTEDRIYGGQRRLYEALAACLNLKVDLSAIWLHRQVEFICRQFGAERLVWGSQLPARSPAAPLMQLNYSDIPEDDLALIAGGNMRQMLSWNPNLHFASEVEFSEPIDELHRVARSRTCLDHEQFHDCHGHIGWGSRRHVIHDRPEDVVAEMDKFGMRTCCVWSFAIADELYGNDVAAEMVNRYPDRFIGFSLINPNRGERLILQELERGLQRGMQGIKLAPGMYQYPEDGPMVELCCQFAHEHGQFMLNHHWGSPELMLHLCSTYPGACFFTGHSNAAYAEVSRAVDNLFICTCPFLAWGQTERFVELYGADRLLFGSDLMDLPIGWGMGPIMYAHISEADKRKILGENLRGLMDKYGIHPLGR